MSVRSFLMLDLGTWVFTVMGDFCIFGNSDNVGDDCPVFDGLFDYCSISAGGSMGMFTFLIPLCL